MFSMSLYKLIQFELIILQAAPADPFDSMERAFSSVWLTLQPMVAKTAVRSASFRLENDNFWHRDFMVYSKRFDW